MTMTMQNFRNAWDVNKILVEFPKKYNDVILIDMPHDIWILSDFPKKIIMTLSLWICRMI